MKAVFRILLLALFFTCHHIHLSAQSFVWAKDIQGTADVIVSEIEIGIDNNLYVVGSFEGTCDFDPGPGVMSKTSSGAADLFFAKYDTSGAPYWVKLVEGPSYERGYNIEVDKNMNILLTGFYSVSPDFDPGPGVVTLPSDGITNGFVAKYNGAGDLLWANPINGNGWDIPYTLKIEQDDHVLAGGSFEDTVDFDPGPGVDLRISNGVGDMFLVRYDRFGNFDWVYTAGGEGEDYVTCIETDALGNIVFSGSFTDTVDFDPSPALDLRATEGVFDLYWSVLDTSGAYLSKTVTMGGTGSDYAHEVYLYDDGNFLVAGSFESTVDFDPGPGTNTLTSTGAYPDIYFAKYDSSGAIIYLRMLATVGIESVSDLEVDADGNFLLTGYFPYNLDIQPNADTVMLTSEGMRDIFVAKYEGATGNLIWGRRLGGPKQDEVGGIELDAFGNFYLCGYFNDSVDFDLESGSSYLVNSNSYAAGYMAKYTNDFATAVAPEANRSEWMLFPNPAHDRVHLVSHQPMEAILLLDLQGRELRGIEGHGALQATLDVSSLPDGMYLVKVMAGNGSYCSKLILR